MHSTPEFRPKGRPWSLANTLKHIKLRDGAIFHSHETVFLHHLDFDQEVQYWWREHYDDIKAKVLPTATPLDRLQVAHLLTGTQLHLHVTAQSADEAVRTLLIDALDNGSGIAFDTETEVRPEFRTLIPVTTTKSGGIAARQDTSGVAGYALNPRKSRVRLLQCFANGDVHIFDMHTVPWSSVAPIFHDAARLFAFNATFDIKAITASSGIVPSSPIFDVQQAMRCIDPCESGLPSMASAAGLLLGVTVPKNFGASDWGAELTDDQLQYAAADAVVTYACAYELLKHHLVDRDLRLMETITAALIPVAIMELNGMPVDTALHGGFIDTWRTELATAEAALISATNGALTAHPTDDEVRDYIAAVARPEILAAWPRTASTGALQANKKSFGAFGADIPGIPELQAVRAWRKGLSTYGPALLTRVEEDGRIYPQFVISGARSGRFSSRNPNIQNIPLKSASFKTFRTVFRATPGRSIIAADYSQIELRIMAQIAQDQAMNAVYHRYGEAVPDKDLMDANDIHMNTASTLCPGLGSLPKVERDHWRSLAKAANFGLIYGSGPAAFRVFAQATFGVELDHAEAAAVIESFRNMYPDIYLWQLRQTEICRALGYVETKGGRRWNFHWRAKDIEALPDEIEEYRINDFLEGFERNFSLNFPIQGCGAELMLKALAAVHQALAPYDVRLTASVHDEIVFDCADQDLKTVMAVIEDTMTQCWRDMFPDAPWKGVVEVKAGPDWKAAH
jgi:DNA polymerase I-like protein with 3'-5' exonuclease and polymerase domains